MTAPDQYGPDSRYAWLRLCVTLTLMTLGASGMYIVSVGLPAIQAEFGVDRSDASTPYTALMIGFGVGGVLMGKLALPILIAQAAAPAATAPVVAALPALTVFALAGVLAGLAVLCLVPLRAAPPSAAD